MKGCLKRRVIIGSDSPLKKQATESVFKEGFDIICFKVDSGIPEQPVGRHQTLQGAINRCRQAMMLCDNFTNNDIVIGIQP